MTLNTLYGKLENTKIHIKTYLKAEQDYDHASPIWDADKLLHQHI